MTNAEQDVLRVCREYGQIGVTSSVVAAVLGRPVHACADDLHALQTRGFLQQTHEKRADFKGVYRKRSVFRPADNPPNEQVRRRGRPAIVQAETLNKAFNAVFSFPRGATPILLAKRAGFTVRQSEILLEELAKTNRILRVQRLKNPNEFVYFGDETAFQERILGLLKRHASNPSPVAFNLSAPEICRSANVAAEPVVHALNELIRRGSVDFKIDKIDGVRRYFWTEIE